MEPMVVLDFETTGLSPDEGARVTEVAAVIVQDGKILSRYQSLMNAGVHVPAFITDLTGISNAMVQSAPSSKEVMRELCDFVGPLQIVAHNASFDKKFTNMNAVCLVDSCQNILHVQCSSHVDYSLIRPITN
jgi:DNA polymerase III subunit epsilon